MNKQTRDIKKIHENYWDQSLEITNVIKEKGPVSRHLQNILISLVSNIKFKSVLDIGCGQGARLAFIEKISPEIEYMGVDIAENVLAVAKKKYPNFSFQAFDIAKRFLNKKFDLVLCLDVLEHIEEDRKALLNIRKMTGKYLIISTIQGRMRVDEGPEGHVRNYQYDDLLEKIKDSHFKIIKVIRWGFPFYSPLYRDVLEIFYKIQKLLPLKDKMKKENLFEASMPIIISILAEPLYQLMRLNSSSRGDYIFVLAKPV